jgi:hypothetical protein
MHTFPTAGEAGGVASGTEEYYSFDYANIHFIVLESFYEENNATQHAWLTNDINSTDQDWIIAFFHHPPYTKGSHDSDSEQDLIDVRANFLNRLEAGGVDLVLNGHSHSYERSYFINGHYGLSGTFDSSDDTAANTDHTVGTNGHLSGQADTSDGAYMKPLAQNEGAVYITTGSAGKVTGTLTKHNAMYEYLYQLGSIVLEIESDGGTGQNLNVKFIRETGAIDDYFTIHKTGITLSTNTYEVDNSLIKLYPVPANNFINVEIKTDEILQKVEFYNTVGSLVKVSTEKNINVRSLNTGMYLVQIITDKNRYYKSIIIE